VIFVVNFQIIRCVISLFGICCGWRYSCYSELANRLLRGTGAH